MNKNEMEKKRDELAESGDYSEGESCSFYMNEIDAFKAGWDDCAEEYEKYIADLRTGITSLNNKILEQAVAIENVKEKLNKATDGYIAWKALKEIKGE